MDTRSRWASATDHSDVSHVEVRRRKLAFFPHINSVVSCQRGCCFPSPPSVSLHAVVVVVLVLLRYMCVVIILNDCWHRTFLLKWYQFSHSVMCVYHAA